MVRIPALAKQALEDRLVFSCLVRKGHALCCQEEGCRAAAGVYRAVELLRSNCSFSVHSNVSYSDAPDIDAIVYRTPSEQVAMAAKKC